jgi:hypothetical protein
MKKMMFVGIAAAVALGPLTFAHATDSNDVCDAACLAASYSLIEVQSTGYTYLLADHGTAINSMQMDLTYTTPAGSVDINSGFAGISEGSGVQEVFGGTYNLFESIQLQTLPTLPSW